MIEDPYGNVLYQIYQVPRHKFKFKAAADGAHKLCFTNRFSSISYGKIVYMLWNSGDKILKATSSNPGPSVVPAIHTSLEYLGNRLRTIDHYQTHQRLKEAIGQKRANNLGKFITYTSLWNMFLIMAIGCAEVGAF